MMATCPECGKLHVVHWPDLNLFRRGDQYYCSHNCWRTSVDRDLSKIKGAALIRRQRKQMKLKKDGTPAKKPGRKPQPRIETPEGDWTPAVNVYGPPKTEVPEKKKPEGNMTVIATKEPPATLKVDGPLKIEATEPRKVFVGTLKADEPENIGEIKRVYPPAEELFPEFEHRVTGIETQVGDFQYFRKQGYLDWTPPDMAGTVSMTVEEWKDLLKLMPMIAKKLGVEL